MGPDTPVEFSIVADTSRYDREDDRWLAQVGDLHQELRSNVDGFRLESTTVPGTKGTVDAVILALGSAGAFSAAVQCFRAWLARDKHRRIVVTFQQDGRREELVIEGDGLDNDTMAKLATAMATRIEDARWPHDTEPS